MSLKSKLPKKNKILKAKPSVYFPRTYAPAPVRVENVPGRAWHWSPNEYILCGIGALRAAAAK
jgi:hypothetical protein